MFNLTTQTPRIQIIYQEEKNDLFFTFICPIVGLCGFFLHTISFFIFSNSEFKELLYKYFKMESFNVLIGLLITSIEPIYYCRTCSISKTYFAQMYFIVFKVYAASIFELSAIINRIISTFCCFIILRNKINNIKILYVLSYYKVFNFFIFSISCLIFFYQLFIYKIFQEKYQNSMITIYIVDKSQFYYTKIRLVLELASFIFRDGINLAILILLNILILISFKKNLSKKKTFLMQTNSNKRIGVQQNTYINKIVHSNDLTNNNRNDNLKLKNVKQIKRFKKCENKQTIMVFITCICFLCGRMPILIFFILRNLNNKNDYQNFIRIASLSIYLTNTINFFLYYYSNKRFKKILNQKFNRFFN